MDRKTHFLTKVEKTPTCWLWTRYRTQAGYGQAKWGKKLNYAHRISYELFVGEIPAGKVLDHLCRNPACVNPEHLEPVAQRTNLLRGVGVTAGNFKKTHCKYGHEFTPDNTYICKKGRNCRKCRAIHGAKWRAKQKELLSVGGMSL